MGQLYKLTSPSGKSYIGITKKTLEARWAKHVEHALGKRDAGALYAALRKYGPESFRREALAECDDWDALCEMEKRAIAEHNTLSPKGYNITPGGEGFVGPRDDEFRRKVSEAQKLRFQRPEERARLKELQRIGHEKRKQKRIADGTYGQTPPWLIRKRNRPKLSKAEHAARTKQGMARPDVKARVKACAEARAADPEWRKRVSRSKTGAKLGPMRQEWKNSIAEARRREWADPVRRAKRMAAIAEQRARKKDQ